LPEKCSPSVEKSDESEDILKASYVLFQLRSPHSRRHVLESRLLSPYCVPVRSKRLELLYRKKSLAGALGISPVLMEMPTLNVPDRLSHFHASRFWQRSDESDGHAEVDDDVIPVVLGMINAWIQDDE